MQSAPPEGGGHQEQFPSPCCFSPLYSMRQHGKGRDLAPGLDATSLWGWWDYGISMLGWESRAGCELAPDSCRAAACCGGAVSSDPSSLEKKMLIELQKKSPAPISKGMQWTFHPFLYTSMLLLPTHLIFYKILVCRPGQISWNQMKPFTSHFTIEWCAEVKFEKVKCHNKKKYICMMLLTLECF